MIIKTSVIFFLANLLSRGVPFLVTALLIRKIGGHEFGVYSVYLSIEALMVPFVTYNSSSALQAMFKFDGSNKNLIFECVSVSLLATIITGGLLIFFGSGISSFISLDPKLGVVAFMGAAMSGLTNTVVVLCRLNMNLFGSFITQVIAHAVHFICLLSLCFSNYTLDAAVGLRFFSIIIGFAFSIGYLLRKNEIQFKLSWNRVYSILSLCTPMVASSIVSLWASGIDKIFLAKYHPAEEVGNFTAIYQIVSVLSVLASSVGSSWFSWLIQKKAESAGLEPQIVINVAGKIIICGFTLTLLSTVIVPLIAKLYIGKNIEHVLKLVSLMVLCPFFELVYLLASPFCLISKRTHIGLLFSITTSCVSLVAMAVLVPRYAVLGGIIGNLVGWVLLSTQHLAFALNSLKNRKGRVSC